MRGVDSVRHELRYGPEAIIGRWRTERDRKAKARLLNDWFNKLEADPPDVLIGANINKADGIRNHILGIAANSALRIGLSPPDDLLERLSYHDFHTTFRREVMEFEPTGVRALHSHVYPYYIEWCRAHRARGRVWVHTYHSPYFQVDPEQPIEPWQAEINRGLTEVARHADIRISVSKWQQKYLESEHGITTRYLPNGVDVRMCDRGAAGNFQSRHSIDHFVLYVGRDDAVKNPEEFLRLAQRMPSVRFVMIGSGLDTAWGQRILDGALPSNVKLLGNQSRLEVQNALAGCAALVLTSRWEGLPTLVLEAMAHGKPIVVSNAEGAVEAVNNGEFGRIYELGDLHDLEANVRAAIDGPARIEGAREQVLREYSWNVIAPQLDSIYRGDAA